jgi:1-acyl-sn-glycerol-3-phosphate acyltransferase
LQPSRSGAITVTRKDARPRILDRLKPFFAGKATPLGEARRLLAEGASLGIFPEGSVNRHPH